MRNVTSYAVLARLMNGFALQDLARMAPEAIIINRLDAGMGLVALVAVEPRHGRFFREPRPRRFFMA